MEILKTACFHHLKISYKHRVFGHSGCPLSIVELISNFIPFKTQNITTMALLKNAVVAKNADISIREPSDDSEANFMNESVYACDMQFNEESTAPETSAFGDLPDDFMSALNQQLSIDDPGVPTNYSPFRRRSSEIDFDETIYGESRDLQNTRAVSEEIVTME